jgi:hypothetical protein
MAARSPRLDDAITRIDQANAEDPHAEGRGAAARPKELVYGERMSAWLVRLAPAASEALQLACRAQHIRRWHIPRADFALDREGYRQWRTTLARFHADTVSGILRAAGYDEPLIARVAALVRKEKYKTDPEAQTLEDAACLVFLENHFADFAAHKDEAKLIDILQKTWRKMSVQGQQAALTIKLPEKLGRLVERALSGEAGEGKANPP